MTYSVIIPTIIAILLGIGFSAYFSKHFRELLFGYSFFTRKGQKRFWRSVVYLATGSVYVVYFLTLVALLFTTSGSLYSRLHNAHGETWHATFFDPVFRALTSVAPTQLPSDAARHVVTILSETSLAMLAILAGVYPAIEVLRQFGEQRRNQVIKERSSQNAEEDGAHMARALADAERATIIAGSFDFLYAECNQPLRDALLKLHRREKLRLVSTLSQAKLQGKAHSQQLHSDFGSAISHEQDLEPSRCSFVEYLHGCSVLYKEAHGYGADANNFIHFIEESPKSRYLLKLFRTLTGHDKRFPNEIST